MNRDLMMTFCKIMLNDFEWNICKNFKFFTEKHSDTNIKVYLLGKAGFLMSVFCFWESVAIHNQCFILRESSAMHISMFYPPVKRSDTFSCFRKAQLPGRIAGQDGIVPIP